MITTNELRRLSALIASPYKAKNIVPSKNTVRNAVTQFEQAYSKAFNIRFTPQQHDEVVKEVMKKLG